MGDNRNSYTIPTNTFFPYVIPGATPDYAGVMTADQAAALQGSIALDPVDIYVDSATGNDTTGNGSEAAPFETFQRAIEAQPAAWKQTCTIHLAAGQYPITLTTFDTQIRSGLPVGQARVLTIRGVQTDQLGQLTAIAGTTGRTVVATVVTTDGALRGAFYRNTTTGVRAMIVGNTFAAGDTTFELNVPVGVAPGDEFVIERPGSEIILPTNGPLVPTCGFYKFVDVKFIAPFAFGSNALISGSNVIIEYEACELELNGVFRNFGVNLNALHMCLFSAAGLYIHAPLTGLVFVNQTAGIRGNYIIDNCLIAVANGGTANFDSLYTQNSSFFVTNCPGFEIFRGKIAGGGGFGFGQIVLNASTGSLGTDAFNASVPNSVEISDSLPGVAGVFCRASRVAFGGVTGTNNATYGINVSDGSVVVVDAVDTTVTGVTNDMLVGTTPTNYAGLPVTDGTMLSRAFAV